MTITFDVGCTYVSTSNVRAFTIGRMQENSSAVFIDGIRIGDVRPMQRMTLVESSWKVRG
jgi:hypothetical protein